MYEYKCHVTKIVDGDTIEVIMDLGFNIFHGCKVRLRGIDTPESRTRNLDEKARGILAKNYLKTAIEYNDDQDKKIIIKTYKENSKGKFGRVIGEVWVNGININEDMINAYHAVPYNAENKKLIEGLHLQNREKLIEQGLFVPKEV